MKSLLLQNKYYYTACFVFILIGGVLLFLSSKIEVTLWVNSRYSVVLDNFILIINELGSFFGAVAVILVLWLIKGWKVALMAVICFVATSLLTTFGKYILFPGAPRPTVVFEDIAPLRLVDGVIQLKTESFPSGHTSSAFAIATFLALILPRKPWHVFLAIAAAGIGYARIYLSQHFITDVYTGMIIGIVTTTLVYWLLSRKSS